MAGRRINLSELADAEPTAEIRKPSFTSVPRGSFAVALDAVAPNPINPRDLAAPRAKTKISEIAGSMRVHGQLSACAVVTRAAFLQIFPEHETRIGAATYVQVNGAQRRAAAAEAGLPKLKVEIQDSLAASRAEFAAATTAENIDRADFDPIEEAQAVALNVTECGSGKAAAEKLGRTQGWVTQRLNLLKLSPDVQALVRSGDVPLREARDLHRYPAEEQMEVWQTRNAVRSAPPPTDDQELSDETAPDFTAVNSILEDEDPGDQASHDPAPITRRSSAQVAIERLGGTPPKIARSLRAELDRDALRELAKLLLDDTDN